MIKEYHNNYKPSFEDMVTNVSEWLHSTDEALRNRFLNSKFEDLVTYHHSLGRTIRNHFSLWQWAWEPVLEDGIDVSTNHPDNVSMRVIEEVWKQAKFPH